MYQCSNLVWENPILSQSCFRTPWKWTIMSPQKRDHLKKQCRKCHLNQPLIFRLLALALEATELWRVTISPSIWASVRNHRKRCLQRKTVYNNVKKARVISLCAPKMCVFGIDALDMFLSLENRLDMIRYMIYIIALIINLHGFGSFQGICTRATSQIIVLVQTILAKCVVSVFPVFAEIVMLLMNQGMDFSKLMASVYDLSHVCWNAWSFHGVYLSWRHAILWNRPSVGPSQPTVQYGQVPLHPNKHSTPGSRMARFIPQQYLSASYLRFQSAESNKQLHCK